MCRFGLLPGWCGELYEFDPGCIDALDAEMGCQTCIHRRQSETMRAIDEALWRSFRRLVDEYWAFNYNDLGEIIKIARIGARIQQLIEEKGETP